MAKTWKQIETSRERRLWFTQVIMPTIIIGGIIVTNPKVKSSIKTTINKVKAKINK